MNASPAQAQLAVFDPSNYSQNLLTAARTLQQINNQIHMLQNQAQGLINQAKNLTTISFPELDALRQTVQQIDQLMGQARVVENIAADEGTLDGIVQRSQGAEGALQVSQATNQLLALVAKQQFQLEHMMAAQYRADALASANRVQAQGDAQRATAKFLGFGNAYTPH